MLSPHDDQMVVSWVDQGGVVFVEMMTSPKFFYDVDFVVLTTLRHLVSAIVPGPWEHDIPSAIGSIWYGLVTNPPTRDNLGGSVINGIAIQYTYISEGPLIGVTFWNYKDSPLGTNEPRDSDTDRPTLVPRN